MVDAKNISEYSLTPASNLALNGISVAEGWLPSTVNNFEREWLSQLAKFYDDFGGVNTVGGTGDAVTITTSTTFTALATGMRFRYIAASANTTAVTLNLDAIGAKAVRKIVGGTDVALIAGDILAGEHYDLVYSTAANSAAGGWIIKQALLGVAGYTTTATAAGTTTLTASSTDTQYFTGVLNQTVTMPVTSTLVLGRTWTFVNPSTGALTINSSGGNLIVTVTAGMSAEVKCILLTGTTAASWSVVPQKLGIFRDGNLVLGDSTGVAASVTLSQGGDVLTISSAVGGGVAGALHVSNKGWDISSASGGQIKFPASQNASANANTLDDYEEGTWTPTIDFVTAGNLSVTYAVQTGTYTKVGRVVTFNGALVTSAFTHTTASGLFRINAFPFAASQVVGGGVVTMRGYTKAGFTSTILETINSSTSMYILAAGSGVAQIELAVADVPTGGTISLFFQGSYVV